jgi:drug/metabolite transporter (DMT)-like permease
MVLAMAGFAIEDAVIKQLSLTMPVSQVLLLIGTGGVCAFGAVALAQSLPLVTSDVMRPWFLVRTVCELASITLFVTAIVYASLSASSAILQATPLAVTLGGAIFLGQRVSVMQWLLICVGFFGVLLLIQPGADGFQPAALFAVASVVSLALRDVITRTISVSIPAVTVSFWAGVSVLLAGVITIPLFGPFRGLALDDLWLLIVSTLAGSAGYFSVVMATRDGDVAVVAPFRYTRLIFALILAIWLFDEPVNLLMILGSSLIIGSGLLMLGLTDKRKSMVR